MIVEQNKRVSPVLGDALDDGLVNSQGNRSEQSAALEVKRAVCRNLGNAQGRTPMPSNTTSQSFPAGTSFISSEIHAFNAEPVRFKSSNVETWPEDTHVTWPPFSCAPSNASLVPEIPPGWSDGVSVTAFVVNEKCQSRVGRCMETSHVTS